MDGLQNRQIPVYTGKVNIVLNGIYLGHDERAGFHRIPVFTGADFRQFLLYYTYI